MKSFNLLRKNNRFTEASDEITRNHAMIINNCNSFFSYSARQKCVVKINRRLAAIEGQKMILKIYSCCRSFASRPTVPFLGQSFSSEHFPRKGVHLLNILSLSNLHGKPVLTNYVENFCFSSDSTLICI